MLGVDESYLIPHNFVAHICVAGIFHHEEKTIYEYHRAHGAYWRTEGTSGQARGDQVRSGEKEAGFASRVICRGQDL